MIAGYDYLIVRTGARRFWTKTRVAGASLLIAGGLLVGIGGAYYGYAGNARANLDRYEVPAVELAPAYVFSAPVPVVEPASLAAIPENSLYSGDAGIIPSYSRLPEGFELIDLAQENALSMVSPATSLRIPAIEIDSTVVELSIQDLGDRRAYQTPNNAVGHIPETSDAGRTARRGSSATPKAPCLTKARCSSTFSRCRTCCVSERKSRSSPATERRNSCTVSPGPE